jgi:imidazolonepropionase-like amidohydrolase
MIFTGDRSSVAVGKFADLVFWDKNSPGMITAVEQDLMTASIYYISLREAKSVIIDGKFRK